jgi:peptide/nickel transport system permease protein
VSAVTERRRVAPVGLARTLGTAPALVAGGLLVALFVGLAIASFFYHDQAYSQDLIGRLSSPGGSHPLGTDSLGRDVLARVMTGTRISLEIGLASVALAGVAGVLLGMVAGYFGGWLDDVLMRISDAVLAIPIVLFALSVLAVVGGGIRNLIFVIAFTQWMIYARTARAETLVVRERPFVIAARSLGAGHTRILRRHVLPQLLPSALVLATLNISTAILLEAGLSFLGLGVNPPTPSLGSMLTEGRQYITRASWLSVYPGLALLLLVLGINLVGDGLRTLIDPSSRGKQAR